MVNINKLRGKIVENGLTMEKLAKAMNVDRTTLYRRISNLGGTFTIKEADAIAKVLNLTLEELNAIFFSQYVAYVQLDKEKDYGRENNS